MESYNAIGGFSMTTLRLLVIASLLVPSSLWAQATQPVSPAPRHCNKEEAVAGTPKAYLEGIRQAEKELRDKQPDSTKHVSLSIDARIKIARSAGLKVFDLTWQNSRFVTIMGSKDCAIETITFIRELPPTQ
jgi:hypothetical protein